MTWTVRAYSRDALSTDNQTASSTATMTQTDPLFPYQTDGVIFLAARKGALLLDEQGLGKTIQAIRAADAVGALRIVVACPASVKENWRREFAKFSRTARRIDVVYGREHDFDPLADTIVVNYDLLTSSRVLAKLRRIAPDLVILDEAHMLKNAKAKRTIAALGPACSGRAALIENARVFALTATPIPNHPGELWPLLRAVAPQAILLRDGRTIMSEGLFVSTYCQMRETRYGPKIVGGKNLDDLRQRIAAVAIRRRKTDVLPQLPAFRAELTLLSSVDAAAKLRQAVAHDPVASMLAQTLSSASDNETIARALVKSAPAMSTLRRMTGLLKAPLVADLATCDLDGGMDKLVLMAVHTDVIRTLRDTLDARGFRPVVIDGSTSAVARQRAIDSFQNDPATRVFIGQITAAGTGITLTAASNLIFAETSWVPADNAQAAMRVHRIGQKNSVLVRLATLPGTVDEAVANTLRRKMKSINELLG
jgi:SWI/SNF-related matrix-associated actin-dependent regulator of chromatin subfamily A-like protein 1